MISPCLEVFDCDHGGVAYVGAEAALASVTTGTNPGRVSLAFDLNAKFTKGAMCRPRLSRNNCNVLSWDVRRYSQKKYPAEADNSPY